MDYQMMPGFSDNCDDCAGKPETMPRSLAMAYIEWQNWQNLYPADVGFERGTIFEDLDMPFIGEEAACDV